MKMFSDRMHWLSVGLALLMSVQLGTQMVQAQAPPGYGPPAGYGMPPGGMPGMGGAMPAGGMMMPDAPMSMSFRGPAPMDVTYAGAMSSCDSSCDAMGGCQGCQGCNSCGGSVCGGAGCHGAHGGGLFGGGRGCGMYGPGAGLASLLGCLAPYSEGSRATQRWYDVSVGVIGLSRTTDVGGVATGQRDPVTGVFDTTEVLSSFGVAGTPALSTSNLDMDKMRYGLEAIANLQTGVGANLEFRYFGLNNWEVSQTASTVASGNPTLFSVFSLFGTSPGGATPGFDDTDRSFVHNISYNSELHNGEINFRRRWVSGWDWWQGSWLGGIRYFDLDERFGFNAVGSENDTFTFDQLRYFNYDVETRNQLTGVQIGGDLWLNILSGFRIGVEGKGGIFGNHAEVYSQAVSNSIPGATEFLQDGKTAYMGEFTASAVYRLSYSWSVRASYNLLYVDNVALAPENFNTRDFANALGANKAFTANRFPFLNTDGEVCYQGYTIAAEWLY